ncbi:MAG: YfiR family protein [Verrucomicrobiota bacterium]
MNSNPDDREISGAGPGRAALSRRRWLVRAAAGLLAGARAVWGADSATVLEYAAKASYLFHFLKYIEWPADALPSDELVIRVGVLGDERFVRALEPVNGKLVKGRKVMVKQATHLAELTSCQLVFISESEKDQIDEILNLLRGTRTVTVSEVKGFAESGGIINFIEERNKVRFQINPEAARRCGVTISSDLLKLAKIIRA